LHTGKNTQNVTKPRSSLAAPHRRNHPCQRKRLNLPALPLPGTSTGLLVVLIFRPSLQAAHVSPRCPRQGGSAPRRRPPPGSGLGRPRPARARLRGLGAALIRLMSAKSRAGEYRRLPRARLSQSRQSRQGRPLDVAHAIGFAVPGPGCRSPGIGSYEEDGCKPGDCLRCWRLRRYKDWPRQGRAVQGRSRNWPASARGREALTLGGRS
jgi:hypothetical protein